MYIYLQRYNEMCKLPNLLYAVHNIFIYNKKFNNSKEAVVVSTYRQNHVYLK